MARDFKAKSKETKGAAYGSSLSFVTGLMVGLTVAAVVYFSGLGQRPAVMETASGPAVAPPASPDPAGQEDHSALAPLTGDVEAPPEPEFDFYTILPNAEVRVPEAELAEPVEPAPPAAPADERPAPPAAPVAPAATASYIVQVGAYQRVEEADQTKALLALQGISSSIQRITKEGQGVWFRVVVGPYGTAQEAQSARVRVGDAGFKGLVLKSVQGSG